MTTTVLVVNHGPKIVNVKVMTRGAEGPEPGMHTPDTLKSLEPDWVNPHSQMEYLVYKEQYLVVEERE